jgi:hypothetical protein
MRPPLIRHAAVFLAYLAITLAWGHFLLGSLSTHFAHDAGDPMLNSWILWWNARTIPFSSAWWNAPAFYPATGVAAFTESLMGLAPITSPVVWITGNPVLAHNVALLLSFPLAGFAAFLLCRELSSNDGASFVGGLAFAFAPYRVAQIPHVQVLQACWLAVTLLALHRFLRTGKRADLVLFGVAWILNGLSNGYYLLFLAVLLALWMFWFVVVPRRWTDLARIAAAGSVASLPLALTLWQYHLIHARYGFQRYRDEIEFFSADIAALATASSNLSLWGWLSRFPRPEGQLFPGIWLPAIVIGSGCLVLCLGGIRPARLARVRWIRALRVLLAVVAAAELMVAAMIGVAGRWRGTIAGMRVSVSSVEQPLVIALIALTVLVAIRAGERESRRPPVLFYGIATVLMWMLTLGPVPKLFGRSLVGGSWSALVPYTWLLGLPGFDSLRAPARFWMMAALCLSVAASMLLARVLPSARWWRYGLVSLLAVGILSDSWASGLPVAPPQRILNCPKPAVAAAALLLLPFNDPLAGMDLAAQWGVNSVNGYSGYVAPHYESVVYGVDTRDHGTLSDLAADKGLLVALPETDRMLDRFVRSHPRATPLGVCEHTALFVIAPDAPLTRNERQLGTALPIVSLTADVAADVTGRATDGDLATRWHSGEQLQDHFLQADLGTDRPVSGIVFELGPSPMDFPRFLRVKVSLDASSWTEVWSGPTHRIAFRAGLSDPKRMPLVLSFVPARARYVRFEQTGRDREFWSVPELRILAR